MWISFFSSFLHLTVLKNTHNAQAFKLSHSDTYNAPKRGASIRNLKFKKTNTGIRGSSNSTTIFLSFKLYCVCFYSDFFAPIQFVLLSITLHHHHHHHHSLFFFFFIIFIIIVSLYSLLYREQQFGLLKSVSTVGWMFTGFKLLEDGDGPPSPSLRICFCDTIW